VRLEQQETEAVEQPLGAASAPARQARETANRWLARFVPLLEDQEALTATECRRRVKLAEALVGEGGEALAALEARATGDDGPLLSTLRAAVTEVATLEQDLRRRLARLSPGDPAGEVDLDAIQAKLAETAARREVHEITGSPLLTPRLEVKTSPASWAGAAGLGIFGLGWSSFTTIHAVLFIGGFWRVIGPFALFFLLFYAMFWAVGFAMLWGAYLAACDETVSLDGRSLVVARRLGPFSWRREATLPSTSRVKRIASTVSAGKNGHGKTGTDLAVTDENGREVRFACMRSGEEQERLMARLNDYLGAQPA